MSAELVLGSLRLAGNEELGAEFNVLGEDVDFGTPQRLDLSIASLLADGDVTQTVRHGNREAAFRVEISASNSGALAEASALLEREVGKRNTLVWTPADGFGAPTVFDVETSSLTWLFNDLDEADGRRVLRRTFTLSLVCLPFTRSLEATTVGSEFVPAEVAIADECESTAGWTDKEGGQFGTIYEVDSTAGNFVSGTGAVKARSQHYYYDEDTIDLIYGVGTNDVAVRKAGLAIDASSGGYLVMWLRGDWPTVYLTDAFVTTSGGGRQSVTPLVSERDANGFMRLAFVVPHDSTVTAFEATVKQQIRAPGQRPPQPYVRIDAIGLAASADSANQSIRSFDVGGSARTEADVSVSALAGLEDVVIYTTPDVGDGFNPAMRRWLTNGSTTEDSKAINDSSVGVGSNEGSALVFKPPAAMLRKGQYSILARCVYASTGSGPALVTFAGSAQLEVDGVTLGPVEPLSATPQSIIQGTGDYYVVNVGTIYLPPVAVSSTSDAVVRLKLWTPNALNLRVDEVSIFPQEEAALTWVRCGIGAPGANVASRLWLDAPSPVEPRPGVLVGNDPQRLDARGKTPMARGRHLVKPGPNLVYMMTGVAGGADLSFTYYKRWHFNAAE